MTVLNWLKPWEPSFVVAFATIVTVFCFVRGSRRISISLARKVSFWAGLASLYTVSHTQFDFYSEHEFFIHRLQHTVLHHVGPFLIALSRPGMVLSAGSPLWVRPRVRQVLDAPTIAAIIDAMNNPAVAATLFIGLIVLWLVPSIHFVAMLDWRWYRAMNWSMAVNGLMFWNLALNAYALRPARLSAAARIGMILAVIPPQIVIGAMISFAPREVFFSYALCGRVVPGIGPVLDQQLGGLILWIPAAMMSVLGILTVINRDWLHRPETVQG
jgi:putative membrane protein